MQLMNTHKDIFVCPELMFMHPLKKDFFSVVDRAVRSGASIESLANDLLGFRERRPYEKTIAEIGKAALLEGLKNLDAITPYSVFGLIIELAARQRGKSICGAKFPVHFTYSENLLKEFPTSKVFYLIRDPRAIFVSDYKKKKKESHGEFYRFPIKGIFLRPVVMFYIIREWRQSIMTYERCSARYPENRIMLMRYEEVLSASDIVVKKVAGFLAAEPSEFSLSDVKIVDSSYSGGLSASRWRDEIFGVERFFFRLLLGRRMRQYGYY
jgi:hypothetical protein